MSRTKKITYLAMGIALYVVLSLTVKIPLINQIKTDFGYLVFGSYLEVFAMEGTIVGAIGCVIGNLLTGGSFPIGWLAGQIFIGVFCGYLFQKTDRLILKMGICILAVFIGIGVIKTLIEVALFQIPFWAKVLRNMIAFVADALTMCIGIYLADKINIRKYIDKN